MTYAYDREAEMERTRRRQMRNDPAVLYARQIDVLERLRALLHELELEKKLSTELHEQVLEARLRTDSEIEALRR